MVRVLDMLKSEQLLKRYKEKEPRRLTDMGCFLSWAGDAAVNTGSKTYPNTTIFQFGIAAGRATKYVQQHSFTVGTGGLGIATLLGNISIAKVSALQRYVLE
jgi:hypothetical protein